MEVILLYLKNTIEICVFGEQVERFLNICSFHHIKIQNIREKEDGYYMDISSEDFIALKEIKKKLNIKIKVKHKKGIYFWYKKQAKRKIFVITPFLCLLLLWMSSHFLWGIRIDGNLFITHDLMEEFLQEQGIYYGMPLSNISINELKSNMRKKYAEITWVSIYLEGTYLHISLKERDTKVPLADSVINSKNLIASASGIVDSVLVRRGTAGVKVGNEVKKGDVLIYGKIDIPSEDGTVKETRYCKAEGDVDLVYSYPLEEIITLEHIEKKYTGKRYQKYMVTFRNKIWEFPFFEIPFLQYDCITKPLEFPLGKIFSLPYDFHVASYQDYVWIKKLYTQEEAKKILEERLKKIIQTLEEKGVQIMKKNVKINTNSAYLSLTGELILKERCNTFEAMEELE